MKIEEKEIKVPTKSGKIKTVTQYILSPDADCILKNKQSGLIIRTFIVVRSKAAINDFEEIED